MKRWAVSYQRMLLTGKLMSWIDENPGKDWLVVVIGVLLAAAVAVYAGVKSYPADYDSAGKLLVDGAKMANDTFKGVGWCAAFIIGWFLERRFVGFSTDISLPRKLTRVTVGLLTYYAVSLILVPRVKVWIPGPAGTLSSCFVQMFFISFIYPWFMTRFSPRKAGDEGGKSRVASGSSDSAESC